MTHFKQLRLQPQETTALRILYKLHVLTGEPVVKFWRARAIENKDKRYGVTPWGQIITARKVAKVFAGRPGIKIGKIMKYGRNA